MVVMQSSCSPWSSVSVTTERGGSQRRSVRRDQGPRALLPGPPAPASCGRRRSGQAQRLERLLQGAQRFSDLGGGGRHGRSSPSERCGLPGRGLGRRPWARRDVLALGRLDGFPGALHERPEKLLPDPGQPSRRRGIVRHARSIARPERRIASRDPWSRRRRSAALRDEDAGGPEAQAEGERDGEAQ